MKTTMINIEKLFVPILLLFFSQFSITIQAQELEPSQENGSRKAVKNTFESVWIIDNQTVMVPVKGTFEFDIAHRFGTVKNGIDDLYGLFAPSNIRLGFSYVPFNNLNLGAGLTKDRMIVDGSLKYAILKQTQDSWAIPVSVTYYGNMSYDAVKDPGNGTFKHETDRLRYYHALIIARKITEKLSVQVAPNLSHQNFVQGYIVQVDGVTKEIASEMNHEHFAISLTGRYKITNSIAFMVNYDQPITKHTINNPNPNLSFGFEFGTSGHSFQLFAGNYPYLNPQRNNLFNNNSPVKYTDGNNKTIDGGNFLIGFNITRLWNF
ncbi:MAG: hypothetical protein IPL31_04260 [Saprospiraceae bacterium]|nr:hypothetical protein [Saprospiraceae bacterium]